MGTVHVHVREHRAQNLRGTDRRDPTALLYLFFSYTRSIFHVQTILYPHIITSHGIPYALETGDRLVLSTCPYCKRITASSKNAYHALNIQCGTVHARGPYSHYTVYPLAPGSAPHAAGREPWGQESSAPSTLGGLSSLTSSGSSARLSLFSSSIWSLAALTWWRVAGFG